MKAPPKLRDPRVLQILTLGSLLVYGLTVLRFDFPASYAAAIILVCLLVQYLCTALYKLPYFEPKSALISALSLCLLLRTNFLTLYLAAAVLTVCSKFMIRVNGKHLWNPTNFGIGLLVLCGLPVWISPGQWGAEAILVAALACAGTLVLHRAARSDITLAFLGFYALMLFARALWLGDPLSIPIHQLESGALIIFAFFMISDPKTTPDSRIGRILFALFVATLAYYIRFKLYSSDALILALFFSAPLVPLLDYLFKHVRYHWPDEDPQRRASPRQPMLPIVSPES